MKNYFVKEFNRNKLLIIYHKAFYFLVSMIHFNLEFSYKTWLMQGKKLKKMYIYLMSYYRTKCKLDNYLNVLSNFYVYFT